MKKLTNEELKKLQKIELEMLIELDRICRKYDIKYSLVGGTLIGAIRHNGFIPWDDDIDVAMLRDDYEKFKNVCEKELDKNKYYFQDNTTEKECSNFIGKIRRKNSIYAESIMSLDEDKQGIWIDIFPADNIYNNKFLQKIMMTKVMIKKILISYKVGNKVVTNSFLKKIILAFLKFNSKFINLEKEKRKLNKYIQKLDNKKTKYVACFGGIRVFKEIIEKKYLTDLIKHDFEEHKFYIPKEYDSYLKHFYGDYMTLPPVDQRITHAVKKIKFPKEND